MAFDLLPLGVFCASWPTLFVVSFIFLSRLFFLHLFLLCPVYPRSTTRASTRHLSRLPLDNWPARVHHSVLFLIPLYHAKATGSPLASQYTSLPQCSAANRWFCHVLTSTPNRVAAGLPPLIPCSQQRDANTHAAFFQHPPSSGPWQTNTPPGFCKSCSPSPTRNTPSERVSHDSCWRSLLAAIFRHGSRPASPLPPPQS